MRIRRLKNTDEIMANNDYLVQEPEKLRGHWRESFESVRPDALHRRLELEIGCGRGKFLTDMALLHPDTLMIGAEYVSTVLARTIKALSRLEEDEKMDNVRLLFINALDLETVFADGEIDRIYLNFSDPWPKAKHAKRRLTSDRFLPVYEKVLSPSGDLKMKTDNDDLFRFSLESLQSRGWKVLEQTDDLHADPLSRGNVMTEYETNFSSKGKNIHYLRAVKADFLR